jgi:Myotubularin-like phosphatase domain
VLSYYHSATDCSIFRSAELQVSAFSNRSMDDEKIIALIPQSVDDPEQRKVVVLNSRQQGVEKNIGQGSLDIKYAEELPSRYSKCKTVFYNVQGAAELGELYLKAAVIGWAMMTADKN